jgi:PKD repeat protein
LLSAVVYAQNAGNRTFNLYDNTNAIIQTVTVEVSEGQHRVALNFDIPAAGLYAVGGAGQKLYRNVTGADYPYTIDSLVSIYSSNFSASPTSAYFYLYDWEVRYCYSEPTLFQVEVTPGPVAAFTASTVNGLNIAFENTTTGTATSYSWDFGDGTSVANVQNPLHTYLTPGLYTVKLMVSDGTCSSEYELVVPVGVSAQEEPVELAGLRIYPNPATDQFFLELGSQPVTDLQLELQDAAGRTLRQQVSSQKRTRIEVEGLPAGVYQLRVKSPAGVVNRKITLVN